MEISLLYARKLIQKNSNKGLAIIQKNSNKGLAITLNDGAGAYQVDISHNQLYYKSI